ncbi:MAG: GspH/FimT family pseudopilin [Ferrimonas sp.]
MKPADLKLNIGFTLVEFMITLTIAAIMLSIALPAMEDFTQNNRSKTAVDTLYQDLTMARQLAASYQNVVTICHLDGANCDGQWQLGYTLFLDADGSNSFTSDDEVIQQRPAIAEQDTLQYSAQLVRFNEDGSSANHGTFIYCPAENAHYNRSIALVSSGVIRHLGQQGSCL